MQLVFSNTGTGLSLRFHDKFMSAGIRSLYLYASPSRGTYSAWHILGLPINIFKLINQCNKRLSTYSEWLE